MKKILLLLILVCTSIVATAQRANFCYKGEWSQWREYPGRTFSNSDNSAIVLKSAGGTQYFAFFIDHYVKPSKKDLKQHIKSDTWFEYTGTVEYCVNDEYPTAESLAKACRFVVPNPRVQDTPTVTRTTRATIKIAPYKEVPVVFNIWFDNIGIGISVRDFH